MANNNYSFSFPSSHTAEDIFKTLLNVRGWWAGLYSEHFTGSSDKINDEFTFSAGDGAHYSKQKLTELVPGKKIAWQVTDSKLTFLKNPNEWTDTSICFDIAPEGNQNRVTFTHVGLVPKIECYNGCAGAWTQYLQNLAEKLK